MARPPEIGNGAPLRTPSKKIEQIATPLNSKHSTSLADIQASRLSRLYALSLYTASTIAALAYGVAR
jgi:hypothetical protein